ncbi:MAG: cellulase family glycosylhydrolase [Blautia sp.]|nr:cellulase family glycosylhydrolase [Blautia sp.]
MRHTIIRIARAIAIAIAALVAIAALSFIILVNINPNKNRPAHMDNPTGYLCADGTNLYDGNGDLLQLKGVNLGNWFVQEFWMGFSSVGDFDTGLYTQMRADAAMKANPNLTDEEIDALNALYIHSYIQEKDFETIAGLGMNVVRIPFTWFNLTTDGETLRENAFADLDWAVSMCEKYGIYAILDLHGAYGSQNQDVHSGDDSQFNLYGNEENMSKACALWTRIAEYYADNATVAGYDLLNEPRRAAGKFGGKVNFDFYDRLYQTVRKVDSHHLLFMECFTFPIHGARLGRYDWENVCIEYHIYNQTPLPQKLCLDFYKALHNMMGYHTPVYIGEWNAFSKEKDWEDTFAYFDALGWSFTSWTYKANARFFPSVGEEMKMDFCNWGLYELDEPQVDLSTASYGEIEEVYKRTVTKEEDRSVVYDIWARYLGR